MAMLFAAKGFIAGEAGATLAEYGLLVGLIAGVCIGLITAVGGSAQFLVSTVNSSLSAANASASAGMSS